MRVIKYSTRLNDARIPILVKESAVNYRPGEKFLPLSPDSVTRLFNDVFDAGNQPQEHVYLITGRRPIPNNGSVWDECR